MSRHPWGSVCRCDAARAVQCHLINSGAAGSGEVCWVANVALQARGVEADDKARGRATPQCLVARVKSQALYLHV